ncbi:MAG: ATP-binding protein [Candidatus Dormibacteria bacterium]
MATETLKLRIGNLGNAVLVTGQAYQDPKDALNEFVSNAADEYTEAERRGGRITVHLRRRGRRPLVAVADDGRGLTAERLRQMARNLFESTKVGDERTLGEKAIGILAFQQLGARCDIVSRPEGSAQTHRLRLNRGQATASLELNERRRARPVAGTTVYISDLDPEVSRVLTRRKVVDYLRIRRGPALARGEYEIEVVEGRNSELVTAERPEGVRVELSSRPTLWGRIEFSLWVSPHADRRRRVAVVGRAGTTIVDDIGEIEDFAGPPWTTDQVTGQVAFSSLQQTSGRRAVLRDRDAFPIFVATVHAAEPAVAAAIERVSREVDEQTAEHLSDMVRRIFQRVLRELDDIDNPMRTLLGSDPEPDGLASLDAESSAVVADEARSRLDDEIPLLTPPDSSRSEAHRLADDDAQTTPDGRTARLPTVAPDPDPGRARSRFDADRRVVLYNDGHPDYLYAKEDETALLDYLTQLVAKEYVVYNHPRASSDEVGEELVRMLVRLRRHVPGTRRRGRSSA